MINLDFELERPPLSAEGQTGLQRLLDLIDANPSRVLTRFRTKVGPFGMFRPSFAIRAHHVRPFISWLVAAPVDHVPVDYVPAESEEQAE